MPSSWRTLASAEITGCDRDADRLHGGCGWSDPWWLKVDYTRGSRAQGGNTRARPAPDWELRREGRAVRHRCKLLYPRLPDREVLEMSRLGYVGCALSRCIQPAIGTTLGDTLPGRTMLPPRSATASLAALKSSRARATSGAAPLHGRSMAIIVGAAPMVSCAGVESTGSTSSTVRRECSQPLQTAHEGSGFRDQKLTKTGWS